MKNKCSRLCLCSTCCFKLCQRVVKLFFELVTLFGLSWLFQLVFLPFLHCLGASSCVKLSDVCRLPFVVVCFNLFRSFQFALEFCLLKVILRCLYVVCVASGFSGVLVGVGCLHSYVFLGLLEVFSLH